MWLEIILGLLGLLGYFLPRSEAVDVIHLSVAARGQQYPFKNTFNSLVSWATKPSPAALSQQLFAH